MKKLVFSTLLLLLCVAAIAKEKTVLRGKLYHMADSVFTLSYQEYALLSPLETKEVPVAADGSFTCILEIKGPASVFMNFGKSPVTERFTLQKENGQDTTQSTDLNKVLSLYAYLLPGDQQYFEVDLAKIEQSLSWKGRHRGNSIYMNEQAWRFDRYKDRVMKNYFGYTQYSPQRYSDYVNQRRENRLDFLDSCIKSMKLSNHLKHIAKQTILGESVIAKINYPAMRATYTNQAYEAPASYFTFMDSVVIDTKDIDKGIGYLYFLDAYLKKKYQLAGVEEDYFDWVQKTLNRKPLYEYCAFALGSNFKRRLYDLFGEDCPYPDIAAAVKTKYSKLEKMLEGNPAPDVRFNNMADEEVKLTDLQGKYLYLDFWATWCGPCIEEIPSLQQLMKDYAGKNILFASISVDKVRDKKKWKDFVAARNMQGEQLWVDAENNKILTETFNMLQIPRFILLDPAGKIVDANAARPSDKRIRQLFDKVLK